MLKKILITLFCFCMPLASTASWACGQHMYIDTSKLGFFGGAVARMSGLAPPAPIFELEHPAMLKATIGESGEFSVNYSRPFFSKNVSMKLAGTKNVELSQSEIMLEDRDGTIDIPYVVTGNGFDSIYLTISGEHKGKSVIQRAQIYIRAKAEAKEPTMQVSGR